ncbi:MAG: hypothetical protein EBR82_41050 [Caulobacteraceae bacterium]|nr:hypothetical protein [Caulobacteraceae bacterium]NDD03545.1 hypothetical protein [Pseudomonadota bacterium]NDG19946.1 hypothetical protein [Betaproteobacteria bacterium]
MAGVTARGGSFTFTTKQGTFSAYVTGLSVESPQAEVVDMTPVNAQPGEIVLVPTGQWAGGSASVDYIHAPGGLDPQRVVRLAGTLTFSSVGYTIQRNAILESASSQASLNDIVRGSLKFRFTDYTP